MNPTFVNPTFVHLRIHSEFSLVDGLVRIKPLVGRVAELGMPAVGLTEQSNMCSLVRFYKAAMGAGIKPVIGADIWLENPDEPANPSRLTLFARDATGYRHLTELVSRGFTEGQQFGKAILKRDWIIEKAEGLIVLSGARMGEIGRALLAGRPELARERLLSWMAVFPDAFYLELQRTGRAGDEECVHLSVQLATDTDCPVVATNDVHFLRQDDFDAHEARVCIGESRTLDDPRRDRRFSDQQYLRPAEEMIALFADIPSAVENTLEIARRCSVPVTLGEYFLPNFPVPDGMTMDTFFRKVSHDGLDARLARILKPDAPDYAQRRQVYLDRLTFELDIIIQMGFPGYFLIVMDFIRWAKSNGVPVGPGRGSGAGSLVAYVLLITDLDPLEYDLLFERFLNPERVSMPDFDVDFCMDGRDRVIAYVADTYGREAVSQIITFGTMAAKAVVRDVARVQGKSYGLADKLSKLIPFEVGMTLKKACEQEEALRDFLKGDEDAQEIWEMALKLEGVTRNAGKHAGGVVIAPTKLTDFAPLYCDEAGGGMVTQFDKNDVEEAGLVKFDFLGLRTLTIIDWALAMINPRRVARQLAPLDISEIPLADAKSFVLLKKAETTAVFQLESRGMKDLVRRLQPDNIEDMIALVALFRPGPLESGMVDDFIARKHGKERVSYPHPDFEHESLKPILEPTYGVIVYQEQVMQIAQALAGYTLGGADMLRRAMGKKKPEEMAKQREIFRQGAIGQGVDPDLAMKIFDLVEKFAGYGFNKSHSAAYAIVSYQTLWLKAHYPAEFMAAVLTADMQNTDKVVTLVEECRHMGLKLVLPNVNSSEFTFTVNDAGEVVYGLGAIKGLGEGPVQSIVEARQKNGAFKDLFDFCSRIDLRKANKRAMEALIRSGALDSIAPGRAHLQASLEKAIARAGQKNRNEDVGMGDLFGDALVASAEEDPYVDVLHLREWSSKERLQGEKETLGLYVTGHPFDQYERELRRMGANAIAQLKPSRSPQKVAGLIIGVRVMKNKKGQTMGFVTLDDRTARMEVALFSDAWAAHKDALQKDAVVIVEGEVSHDDYSDGLKLKVSGVLDIAVARQRFSRGIELVLDAAAYAGKGMPAQLESLLSTWRGKDGSPVRIRYQRPDALTVIKLGSAWQVRPDDDLLMGLRNLLGEDRVRLVYD